MIFIVYYRLASKRGGGGGYQDLDASIADSSPVPIDFIIGQDIEMTSVSVVPDGKHNQKKTT